MSRFFSLLGKKMFSVEFNMILGGTLGMLLLNLYCNIVYVRLLNKGMGK